MEANELSDVERALMVHAVAADHPKRHLRGYRNRFATVAGDDDDKIWEGLVSRGMAVFILRTKEMNWYSVTQRGCQALGMHKAAIKRAVAVER